MLTQLWLETDLTSLCHGPLPAEGQENPRGCPRWSAGAGETLQTKPLLPPPPPCLNRETGEPRSTESGS